MAYIKSPAALRGPVAELLPSTPAGVAVRQLIFLVLGCLFYLLVLCALGPLQAGPSLRQPCSGIALPC